VRSRLQILASQPRLALGALLTLLLAAGAVVGSGADFTASSANPSNTFAAGTLSIANSKEGVAVLTASDLRPGDAAEPGTVTIRNSGSLEGDFELKRDGVTNSDADHPLDEQLNLTVTDCGTTCGDGDDVEKYDDLPLADMPTIDLGTFAAGAERTYRFDVELSESAGNEYQGGSSTVEFDFDAS